MRATHGCRPVSPNGPFGHRRLRTYRDATAFLESLVRTPPRTREERESLGLSPIEALLDRIGNPHHGLAAIHITGSKGKGSTALYIEALLAAAGLRTGTFTSPHLEDWNERIRIAGAPIGRAGFVEAMERVRPGIEDLHRADADSAPAFFDALVAAAFSAFADAGADIAVVEAGIGARLDPTRACRAVATCVTSIELEHADRLGPAITDIAREKAAIRARRHPAGSGLDARDGPHGAGARGPRGSAPRSGVWGRDITVRHGASPGDPERGAGRGRSVARTGTPFDSGTAEVVLPDRTIPLSAPATGAAHDRECGARARTRAGGWSPAPARRRGGGNRARGDGPPWTHGSAARDTSRRRRRRPHPSFGRGAGPLARRPASRRVRGGGLGHAREERSARALYPGAARGHRDRHRGRPFPFTPGGDARTRSAGFEAACFDRGHRRAGRCAVHGGAPRRTRRARVRDRLDVHGGGAARRIFRSRTTRTRP